MDKIAKIVINLNGTSVEYNLGTEIVDNLESTDTTKALSAALGNALNQKLSEDFYTKDEVDSLFQISINQLANLIGGNA